MRQGMAAASRSALFGGVLLALIEGAGIMLNKVMKPPPEAPIFVEDLPGGAQGIPQKASSSSASTTASWFGGLFGKEKEKKSGGGGVKTEILESFDSPIPTDFRVQVRVDFI
ncbi:mitochondrial import inner membrane translocase subunit tim17-2 [Phtheirospermum japonicum]|uniref:Mitochondrial import inner membrane translocase subunit tim17-2 n=1 Tax=Phtheirospermum japonicum TaxID=374723 RepID=A0A830DCI6_9LAMI|nr:mitochondrial import inner membrane translocase subunit tim17-2 [Phtheirospermum japonicum]